MENSLISIIVPVYNVETYISECIESIQNQTYQKLQIILVDDGSVDQSGSICDAYALEDSRIEVIHQHNLGVVAARKSGLDKAKGEYIGFVDGDDYIEPEMYEVLLKEMKINKVDFVHSGFWEDDIKRTEFLSEKIELPKNRYDFLKDVILEGFITPSNWSKLFKADLVKKAYNQIDNNCVLGEDLLILCICILECDRISIVKDCCYHYRIREGSLSHRNDISNLKKLYKLYEDLFQIFSFYKLSGDYKSLVDKFFWKNLINYMERIRQDDFQMAKYYFKYPCKLHNKQIVVYGAGVVGRDYYAQICRYSDCKVVAWVDAHPERYLYKHITVYGREVLDLIEFDILIIAVLREAMANNIRNELVEKGVDRDKIYWVKPERWGIDSKGSV